MSYPSVQKHLSALGVTVETATDPDLRIAFERAFRDDLPLGFAQVEEMVKNLHATGRERVMCTLDPGSEEGKQFARLLGADIPREVLEQRFGVALGFYNCCKGVAARDRERLALSMREQIEAQDPQFVDC